MKFVPVERKRQVSPFARRSSCRARYRSRCNVRQNRNPHARNERPYGTSGTFHHFSPRKRVRKDHPPYCHTHVCLPTVMENNHDRCNPTASSTSVSSRHDHTRPRLPSPLPLPPHSIRPTLGYVFATVRLRSHQSLHSSYVCDSLVTQQPTN